MANKRYRKNTINFKKLKKMQIATVLVFFLALIMLFSGCKPVFETNVNQSLLNFTEINTTNLSIGKTANKTESYKESYKHTEKQTGIPSESSGDIITKIYTEGDLVVIKPKVIDPDNDTVYISFSKPLDSTGKWQTKEGDAGTYIVTITATDKKATTTKKVRLIIKKLNHAPELGNIKDIEVNEGDIVELHPVGIDQDNDTVEITFSGWMTTNVYKTTYDDAGIHEVVITASDGKAEISKTVKITVHDVNRPPVIAGNSDLTATEGETINLNLKIYDPDNDSVDVVYSDPFDSNGIWRNATPGVYDVKVTATDSKSATAEKTIHVVVNRKNHPPVIEIDDVVVSVSETKGNIVKLNPKIYDEDNDRLTVSYSGWMELPIKKVTYSDAGTHKVVITASDGKTEVSKEIFVTVNRAPVFVKP